MELESRHPLHTSQELIAVLIKNIFSSHNFSSFFNIEINNISCAFDRGIIVPCLFGIVTSLTAIEYYFLYFQHLKGLFKSKDTTDTCEVVLLCASKACYVLIVNKFATCIEMIRSVLFGFVLIFHTGSKALTLSHLPWGRSNNVSLFFSPLFYCIQSLLFTSLHLLLHFTR